MLELVSNPIVRVAAAFAVLSGFGTAPVSGAEPRVMIDWNLAPNLKVGSHKSGVACFPRSSLRWQEIAKPDPAIITAHLETLVALKFADPEVSGKLTSIKASLCTPWLGVGEAEPKSAIKISMRWTFREADGTSSNKVVDTEVARKRYDLRFDPTMFMEAVETSLREALSQRR